jgi:hypothetical protein
MQRIKLMLVALAAMSLLVVLPAAAQAKKGDHDGMPSKWERANDLSTKKNDARKDPDVDGLRNLAEYESGTDPQDADSDNDGTDDADADQDGDNVDNGTEADAGTDPCDKDTDNDGTNDGREDGDRDDLALKMEDVTGNDPADPDTDGDQVEDGQENAGVVSSFDADTGKLVIALANGDSMSGLVNDQTRIGCQSEEEHECGHSLPPAEEGNDDRVDSHFPGPGGAGGFPGEGDSSGPGGPGGHRGPGGPDGFGLFAGDADDECTVDDLVADAVVHSADIRGTASGAVFTRVELVQ